MSKNTRKIKQVYISEDGGQETVSETVKEIAKDKDKEENKENKEKKDRPEDGAKAEHAAEHKGSHLSEGGRTVRIIAIAVAMFFSLILAMSVGVGLALWDESKTIADLRAAMFGYPVAAATIDPSEDKTGAISMEEPYDEESAYTDEAAEPEPAQEEEDDYGQTINSSASKAGSEDEIVTMEEGEAPPALDPTANYPLPFTKVDESYFTDALFIGDSRLQGFGFWSGLPATYYCATGFQLYKYDTTKVVQTENGKVPIFDAMPYDAFTKIYIKVGLNELGYGTEENFEKKYAELIAKLREYEPRAVIYVHGILPVTAAKSEKDKAHNNPNILVRNASLEKFAKTQKAYYLDAGPALAAEDGSLRPEITGDGIHLKPEYMKIWREYLCEHAIVIE